MRGWPWRSRSAVAAASPPCSSLVAVWIELQWEIPFGGVRTSGLIAFPVLVTASGILLGSRVGYGVAALTTLSLAALCDGGPRDAPGAGAPARRTPPTS